MQLQPVSRLPDTDNAIPLQLAAIVHVREQLGIVPLKPAAQELQSSLALNCAGQSAQFGRDHWLRHVHTQFGINPVTLVDRLLQSDATQIREQLG